MFKLGMINSAWEQTGQPLVWGLEKTKQLGFDTVDIFLDPTEKGSAPKVRQIVSTCKRLKLPIKSVCCCALGIADFNPSVREFHVARVKKYLDMTKTFGAHNLLLVLGEYMWQQEVIPPKAQWDWAVEACRELGAYAKKKKLEIALELEPFKLSLLRDMGEMVHFLDECGQPQVKANIDISHMVLSKTPPSALRALKGRAAHVHISDCDGKVHGDLPPGRGVVDFIPYLKEIGVTGVGSGVVSLELEYSPDPAKIEDWVKEAYDSTRKLMAAAGI